MVGRCRTAERATSLILSGNRGREGRPQAYVAQLMCRHCGKCAVRPLLTHSGAWVRKQRTGA